jgi:mannose-1-phosphate guanylyltransferase
MAASHTDARAGQRWGLVLAGGDGVRLRSLTRQLTGDERPKQFCPVLGDETLLEQTWRRLLRVVAPAHGMVVVTRKHQPYYTPLLDHLGVPYVAVQPENRGTAAGILYPLLRLAALAPGASVAVLPSDHHFSDDARLMDHVEAAFEAVAASPGRLVLLGMIPDTPESEYGWIERDAAATRVRHAAIHPVLRFWEKPDATLAERLRERGCLWNSFVMVGAVDTFLAAIACALPALFGALDNVAPAFGGPVEDAAVARAYATLEPADFSREVLTTRTGLLSVMPVRGVSWSDLGSPERVRRARRVRDLVGELAGAGAAA